MTVAELIALLQKCEQTAAVKLIVEDNTFRGKILVSQSFNKFFVTLADKEYE